MAPLPPVQMSWSVASCHPPRELQAGSAIQLAKDFLQVVGRGNVSFAKYIGMRTMWEPES